MGYIYLIASTQEAKPEEGPMNTTTTATEAPVFAAQLARDEALDLEIVWQLRGTGRSIVEPLHAVADAASLKALLTVKMQFTSHDAWAVAVRFAGVEGDPIAVVLA